MELTRDDGVPIPNLWDPALLEVEADVVKITVKLPDEKDELSFKTSIPKAAFILASGVVKDLFGVSLDDNILPIWATAKIAVVGQLVEIGFGMADEDLDEAIIRTSIKKASIKIAKAIAGPLF